MDIIAAILSLITLLWSCRGNNPCYLSDLQENKDALDIALEELKDVRDDVKRRVDEAEKDTNEAMKCNQIVKGWLQRVEAIQGEMVEVIQKADKEIKGRCMGGYCSKNCWSANKIGKLVIQKLAIVNDLRSKGSFGDVVYKLPPSIVQKVPTDPTVGMDSMFDKVWRSIVEAETRIVGLYGYGGVGKTTLLKQINNEFLKSTTTAHDFDVVILVVVSKVLNIDAIQKEIGKRLGFSSTTEPDTTNIFNALTKMNFVLLLDDIWERVNLQSIGIPPLENSKSKVVFTTRSQTVCRIMEADKRFRVECLLWNEAWILFQKKVGNETLNSHPKIPELAEVVARECGGIPLALITVGRAMSTKKSPQEWNYAITTLRRSAAEFPGMGDEILPLLKLSYDSLHNNTVKSCFLYCALYPEDWSIDKARLIDYWIGEGIILLNEFDHIDNARNQGYDVIGHLKGACLLESGGDKETQVKMHDTIRDLALWIAHEYGSKKDKILIMGMSDLMSQRLWHDTERIYLKILHSDVIKVSPLKFPTLLTLIVHRIEWSLDGLRVPENFFEFMPLLRVLDLSNSRLKIFPKSITELLELQYLSLSTTDIKALPEELRKLVKLKYLDLSYMDYLMEIPSGVIGSLVELRVLNLHRCSGAEAGWDLKELYNLKHLNDLGINVNTQDCTLDQLLSSTNRNLQMCTRHLHLFTSSSVASSSTRVGSTVKSLKKLELLLSSLETLSLRSLHELMSMTPQYHHLRSCFQNLGKVEIYNCDGLKHLAWVGYLNSLKRLVVSSCCKLEEIVIGADDFGGSTGGNEISTMMNNVKDVFKRLKILNLTRLPKLKSICRNALTFPCLEFMHVNECPELKKLPFDFGSNVNNTLREISGEQQWWYKLQWEEDHHSEVKSKFLPYFNDLTPPPPPPPPPSYMSSSFFPKKPCTMPPFSPMSSPPPPPNMFPSNFPKNTMPSPPPSPPPPSMPFSPPPLPNMLLPFNFSMERTMSSPPNMFPSNFPKKLCTMPSPPPSPPPPPMPPLPPPLPNMLLPFNFSMERTMPSPPPSPPLPNMLLPLNFSMELTMPSPQPMPPPPPPPPMPSILDIVFGDSVLDIVFGDNGTAWL